jgi:hypothetical protein
MPVQTAKKSFAVFKDAAGRERWLAITTSAYQDRDREIISTKALANAVAQGDATGQSGTLRYWHVPGMDIGDCDYQATMQDGRFLIESGTFRGPAYAELGRRMAAKGYQMSPGFLHIITQPRDGTFDDIAIFERSPVPAGRASNVFTHFLTKEDRMLTKEKETELRSLLGDQSDLLDQLLAKAVQTDKAAQSANVAYKDDDSLRAFIREEIAAALKTAAPADAAAPPLGNAEEDALDDGADDALEDDTGGLSLSPDDLTAIGGIITEQLAPLVKALDIATKLAGHVDELKGMMGGVATKDDARAVELTALKEQQAKIDARLKELEGDQPRGGVWRPGAPAYRASAASDTVTTNTSLKEGEPAPDPINSFFNSFGQHSATGV